MKRSHAVLSVLTGLLLFAGLGLTSTAFAKRLGRGPDPVSRLEAQVEALELDEESRTAIYGILDEARAVRRELRSQVREAREGLHSLLEQEEPDEAAVLEQADVIGTLQTQLRKQGLSTLLQVRALLTPEQRESLREAMPGPGGRGPMKGPGGCEPMQSFGGRSFGRGR
jgi:Spy/CpxP family protein refolding chaperone